MEDEVSVQVVSSGLPVNSDPSSSSSSSSSSSHSSRLALTPPKTAPNDGEGDEEEQDRQQEKLVEAHEREFLENFVGIGRLTYGLKKMETALTCASWQLMELALRYDLEVS